jgi:hypothetical protein
MTLSSDVGKTSEILVKANNIKFFRSTIELLSSV